MTFKHPPTAEQHAIFDACNTGDDVTVEAVAGSGKTTTLVGIAGRFMLKGKRGLYVAYNKEVQKEAESRFPRNTVCRTGHALAYNPEYGRRMKRVGYAKPTYVAKALGIRAVAFRDDAPPMKAERIARIVMDTVTAFCRTGDPKITIMHVPHVFGIESEQQKIYLADVVVPKARKAWNLLRSNDSPLKFGHGHYLKDWQLKVCENPDMLPTADFLMLDEAQDSNGVILAVIDAMQKHRGMQVIACGDSAQGINAWNGAVDAMDRYPGKRLPLTKSFRFGPAVADEANKYLDALGISALRVVGHEPVSSRVGPFTDTPDAILCRTNGGVIAEIMQLIELDDPDMRIAVTGGSRELKEMAEAALILKDGGTPDHIDLAAFTDWDDLREHCEDDPSLGSLRRFVKAVDRWGPWGLIMMCKDLVDDVKGSPTVTLSTAHRAKGKEWGSVQIGNDFPAPGMMDEDGEMVEMMDADELRAEMQLAYVSVTRAKTRLDTGSLTWIDDMVRDHA